MGLGMRGVRVRDRGRVPSARQLQTPVTSTQVCLPKRPAPGRRRPPGKVLPLAGPHGPDHLTPAPPPPSPRRTGGYSLARMTMSMPQKMLMIQPTMTMAVRVWMRAAAMLSQKTQHTCLSGRSVRAPHSTAKAETNVPMRHRRGTAF